MNAGALDAQGDSQVDGGPARLLLPAVTTHVVPGTPGGDAQCRGAAPLGGVSTTRGRGEFFGLKTNGTLFSPCLIHGRTMSVQTFYGALPLQRVNKLIIIT